MNALGEIWGKTRGNVGDFPTINNTRQNENPERMGFCAKEDNGWKFGN